MYSMSNEGQPVPLFYPTINDELLVAIILILFGLNAVRRAHEHDVATFVTPNRMRLYSERSQSDPSPTIPINSSSPTIRTPSFRAFTALPLVLSGSATTSTASPFTTSSTSTYPARASGSA